MITFQAFGVRFTLPLLTLLTPILAMHLGMQGGMGGIMLALGTHELAHVIIAKLMGVQITEIRLMPFGGSARMENPYGLPSGRMIPVAAAGPIANLMLAVVFAALAQWKLLSPEACRQYVQPNLVLFLFNLLPALPLDGGRILYALLQGPLGDEHALKTGLWLGRVLALCLLAASAIGGLGSGTWNLSFILAAIFIFASERDEKSALVKSRAQRLSDLLAVSENIHPARLYQLDMNIRVNQALKVLRPREQGWFVLTRAGQPEGMIDGRSILEYIVKGGAPDAALGDLPYFSISPAQPSVAGR